MKGMTKLENVVCVGSWTWPWSRRWCGNEWNLRVASPTLLRHPDYFSFVCSTNLFNKYLLSICFVQKTVRRQGETWFTPPSSPGKGEDTCLCNGCCVWSVLSGRPGVMQTGRGHLWLGLEALAHTSVFTQVPFFLPFDSLFLNLHQFCREKGSFVCRYYSGKLCVQREECHIGPQKTGWLPEFWFQHPVFSWITT